MGQNTRAPSRTRVDLSATDKPLRGVRTMTTVLPSSRMEERKKGDCGPGAVSDATYRGCQYTGSVDHTTVPSAIDSARAVDAHMASKMTMPGSVGFLLTMTSRTAGVNTADAVGVREEHPASDSMPRYPTEELQKSTAANRNTDADMGMLCGMLRRCPDLTINRTGFSLRSHMEPKQLGSRQCTTAPRHLLRAH